jgi:hypothetical protein
MTTKLSPSFSWVVTSQLNDVKPPSCSQTGWPFTQTFADGEQIQIDARVVGVGAAAVAIALRAPIIVAMAIAAVVTALVRLAV